MQYQQVYQKRTRGELRNVLDYQLKASTKGDHVLCSKICVKGIFVLYIGCFIDVVLEFCIMSDNFKDEMGIIDPVIILKMKWVLLIRGRV